MSSLVAGVLAVCWLMQILRGHISKWGTTDVEINIIFFAVVASCFGLAGRRRELAEKIRLSLVASTLYSATWAARFVFKLNNRREPDFGAAGLVTFGIAVGLVVVAALVHRELRRSAAQPAVAPDGASPDR